MNKPDLLLTQIKHCDYGIFRARLRQERDFFGKIIIYFNENNRFPYLDHFMHEQFEDLGNVVFIDQVDIQWGIQDWRNLSTREMLKHSDSEWVTSIEQDWFARDWKKLLDAVVKASDKYDLIGWENEAAKYIHPGFWFMKREQLERTRHDFSAIEGIDHFGLVTRDLRSIGGSVISTQELGFRDISTPENTDCFHLGGVNQNFLEGLNQGYQFHRGEVFKVYNYWNMKAPVKQNPRFISQSIEIQTKLDSMYPDVDPETNGWKEFFK